MTVEDFFVSRDELYIIEKLAIDSAYWRKAFDFIQKHLSVDLSLLPQEQVQYLYDIKRKVNK